MFVGKDSKRGRTIHANFNALFLGTIDQLVPLIGSSFPELGLKPEDCKEMSWIRSILYSEGGDPNQPLEVLLDRIIETMFERGCSKPINYCDLSTVR